MKTLIYILMIIMLIGCSSSKSTSNNQQIIIQNDTIQLLVPVVTPEDSAMIRAKLECDKNGRILLSWLDAATSRNVDLKFKIDSLGNLLTSFKTNTDTIYIPSYIIRKKIETTTTRTVTVKVEKKLNFIQKFCMCFTPIMLIILIIYFFPSIKSLIKKWL